MRSKLFWPAVFGTLMLSPVALADRYKGYEIPPYTVVQTIGAVEIRDYAPHTVAEVAVRGTQRQAVSTGFRTLFRYIAGGNSDSKKIAMTAPVSQIDTGDGSWAIRFMMPEAAVQNGLPVANANGVTLREVAGGREAVVAFAGWSTRAAIARAQAQLEDVLRAKGLRTQGAVRIYYYDDPFTLPQNRRTEVSLALR